MILISLSGIYFLYTLNRQFMQRATEVDGNVTRFAAIWSTKTSTDIFWLITFIIMSVTSQNVRLDARIWRDHWRYWSHDDPKWWDNKNCHMSEPQQSNLIEKKFKFPVCFCLLLGLAISLKLRGAVSLICTDFQSNIKMSLGWFLLFQLHTCGYTWCFKGD